MSIIKGTNQIVAGFGGTKRSIGEVYFSQSALATDNSGALPLFTGETIASANTIYPEFYNWVLAHTELQCTSAEYESSLTTYGECAKYVIGTFDLVAKWEFHPTQLQSYHQLGYVTDINDIEGSFVEINGDFNAYTHTISPTKNDNVYYDENCLYLLYDFDTSGTATYRPVVFTQGYEKLELLSKRITSTGEVTGTVISKFTFNSTEIDWGVEPNSYIIVQPGTNGIRLPLIKNYIKAANPSEGIKNIEAGLPNITGGIPIIDRAVGGVGTGAFYSSEISNRWCVWQTAGDGGALGYTFDASLSNPIYGKSSTVTPASTTLYPWVVAYTAAIPASTAQAAEFQQGLSGKADNNLGNITDSGKEAAVSWGRNFLNTNQIIASGPAGIAGTYNLGFTDGKVKIGVFACAISTNKNGFSNMAIKTDIVTGDCIVAGTNNLFAAQSTATIPFVNSVSISFPNTGAGISTASVRFVGYFE